MVCGKVQGREQPVENPNSEFMALLLNIQQRLDDKAATMQQQVETIRNLQQQQGRILDLEFNGFQNEGLNIDQGGYGNGGNNHGSNGVEDPLMGMLRGNGPES